MATMICRKCEEQFETARRFTWYCPSCYKVVRREQGRKSDDRPERRFPNKCEQCAKPISRHSQYCRNCAKKGERNQAWKGGRHKSIAGYIYILKPDHPRANKFHDRYVAEHRLVWEKAHNQLLPEGYLIHHLNGIKDDNRPENLVALQPKRHSKRTRLDIAEQRIRELEQQLRDK